MSVDPIALLVLHGWHGSGLQHWQTFLARRAKRDGLRTLYPQFPSPSEPELGAWLTMLTDALRELRAVPARERVVCAHSLGAILWLHHAARQDPSLHVDRVLLVAPPSEAQVIATGVMHGFAPVPVDAAAVAAAATATTVVATLADPYCPPGADACLARPLGVPFVRLPDTAGHINPEAGYGEWPSVEAWVRDAATVICPNDAAA